MPDRPNGKYAKALGLAAFFTVVALLLPPAVHWDGLGFLEWARDPVHLDFGHLIYVPLLRLSGELFGLFGAGEVLAAKLLSAAGAALSFVLLWRRLERRIPTRAALVGALLVATTPLFWGQAGTVEPSTLTIAVLLLCANAAERYGRDRSALNAALLCVCGLALLGLHVVSLCALPWLVHLSRGPRPPAWHALLPLAFLAALVGVLFATGQAASFLGFPSYWRGFLPPLAWSSLRDHAVQGMTLLWDPTEGVPVLALVGLASLAWIVFSRRRTAGPLLLAVPYLAAFVLLGKPQVGLLLPVTVALGLFFGEAVGIRARRQATRQTFALYVVLSVSVQLCGGLALAFERAGRTDDRREVAELLAASLPDGAILLVGPVGHHLTWFTDAPAVVLPDELHDAGPRGPEEAAEVVRTLAAGAARDHAEVYLTSEALEFLETRWGVDPERLGLERGRTILVRLAPELTMIPFASGVGAGVQ